MISKGEGVVTWLKGKQLTYDEIEKEVPEGRIITDELHIFYKAEIKFCNNVEFYNTTV